MPTPAKKLLFMGQEFAQREEFTEARSLDWHLLQYDSHRGVQSLVADLNQTLRRRARAASSRFRLARFRVDRLQRRRQQHLLVHPPRQEARRHDGRDPQRHARRPIEATASAYRSPASTKEVLNTDAAIYGGSNVGNMGGIQSEDGASHGPRALAADDPASAGRCLPEVGGLVGAPAPGSPGLATRRLGALSLDVNLA